MAGAASLGKAKMRGRYRRDAKANAPPIIDRNRLQKMGHTGIEPVTY